MSHDIKLHACQPDGNITNIRYREIANILCQNTYDQVLAIDGGDIIFQDDISHLFEQHKNRFRGVCEEIQVPFHEALLPKVDVPPEVFEKIAAFLDKKPTINGGMILGPSGRFAQLWEHFQKLWRSYQIFGTDQLVLNYLLYSEGFVRLPSKYNFAILTMRSNYVVRQGVFYDERGDIIPVVHNCGMRQLTRSVARFGYGVNRNQPKPVTTAFLRLCFRLINAWRWFRCLFSQKKLSVKNDGT